MDTTRQFLSGTRKDAASKPPFLLAWRSSSFFIVLTVCLAIFTDIFYYALIIPVIPFSLTVQIGIPEDKVQHWTSILLACYSLALFLGSPVAGFYADHTSSRRRPLLIGLLALAGSTLLLCFGKTIALLVVERILQGFSASIVWSVGCALLVDTMATAVGVAMGYTNIAMSVGLLIAPALGGAVYDSAGYYAVYYIAFGIVAVDILLRLGMIEKKAAKQWIPGASQQNTVNDVENTATAVSSVDADVPRNHNDAGGTQSATEINGRQEVETRTSPTPEGQSKHGVAGPVIILIKSPRLLAALYCLVVEGSTMMGFDAVLALFVKSTFAWNSTAAGVLFLALFLPGFVSPVAGWLADRFGPKWPSLAGFVVTVPILVCLRFVNENTVGDKVLLAALLAILGVALSFSNTPLMAEISYSIEEKETQNPGVFGEKGVYGIGYGLFTMAFALGGVIGPLWAGYVNAEAGWGTMAWSFAVWSASGAVVVYLWLGGTMKFRESKLESGGIDSRRGLELMIDGRAEEH